MSEDKHVVNEVRFGGQTPDERETPPGYDKMGGAFITPKMRAFIEAAMDGKLPDLGDIPEQDPRVVALAEELMVIHLPEWTNPAGRKIAEPTVMKIGSAVRLAEYFLRRGIEFHPDKATVRWVATPGAHRGADDPGKHIYRNDDGSWPELPDAEAFWDIDDIKCEQLPDGRWTAVHPNGIQTTDASRTEAYAMCVERVRAKVAELKGDS